jgi:hypothetical protein
MMHLAMIYGQYLLAYCKRLHQLQAHSDLAKTNLAFVPWFKDPVGRQKRTKEFNLHLSSLPKKKKEKRHAVVLIGR